MDVKFPNGGQKIEYNILGGVVDMFFLNGPTPADVARQGTQVWGVPAEVPYWSLGVGLFMRVSGKHTNSVVPQLSIWLPGYL